MHFKREGFLKQLRIINIEIQVQETWFPNYHLIHYTFRLKVGPKLEIWFLKLGETSFLDRDCRDVAGK